MRLELTTPTLPWWCATFAPRKHGASPRSRTRISRVQNCCNSVILAKHGAGARLRSEDRRLRDACFTIKLLRHKPLPKNLDRSHCLIFRYWDYPKSIPPKSCLYPRSFSSIIQRKLNIVPAPSGGDSNFRKKHFIQWPIVLFLFNGKLFARNFG